jgi:isopentenyl diphosphate isomerase/L-lactate dehydrogenase-like FMN-dependent dehydrogenase
MLVDTSARHARITLFGRESRSPLIIAPTGLNGMLGRGSDVALARAAAAHGIPFTQSTLSNERIERIAREAPGRLWMQLYMLSEPAITEDILRSRSTPTSSAPASGMPAITARPRDCASGVSWMRHVIPAGPGGHSCRAVRHSS